MLHTRDEIVDTTYAWEDGSVEYDMARPPGTMDCSSYVARCLGLDNPDLWSTVNLPRLCREIPPGELRRGDLIGEMGPGTSGGDGHVQVFIGWAAARLYIAEMTPEFGPTHREIPRIAAGYKCWRPLHLEVEPSMNKPEQADAALYVLIGSDTAGVPSNPTIDPAVHPKAVAALAQHNLSAVEERLNDRIDALQRTVLAAIAAQGGTGGPTAHTHTVGLTSGPAEPVDN